jgi:prophage antirepressor-like protein
MNNLISFEFEQKTIESVIGSNNEPWFIARQVADVLGYAQTNNMNKLIDNEDKRKQSILHSGGNYINQSLINESGLYVAIFGSKLPDAKRFKRWVVAEVLPSIRKHGGYTQGQEDMSGDELLAKAVLHAQSVIREKDRMLVQQQYEIEEAQPKVAFYNSVGDTTGLLSMNDAIKSMNITGLGRNKAMEELRSLNILQSSLTNRNVPYQQYINQGYFNVKQKLIQETNRTVSVALVTPKGLQWLYKKLA